MSRHRTHRVDNNQGPIVTAVLQLGGKVLNLTQQGNGCPDLLIQTPSGDIFLCEIKAPGEQLRPKQAIFAGEWPVWVVHDIDEMVNAINQTTKQRRP